MSQISTLLIFVVLIVTISNQVCKCQNSNRTFSPEENPGTENFEGDIVISEDEEEMLENGVAGAGVIGDHFRWPHRTIPYVISSKFSKKQKTIIQGAMKEIEKKTCIKFKKRKNDKDYIFIRDGSGCSSLIGRENKGQQDVTLSIKDTCVTHGIAMHELVHSIGFWHEQSRTDRDKYVEVKEANVIPIERHNFDKYTSKKINDFGVPYDYNSVMHYHDRAFISDQALKKQQKTIVPLKPGVEIGQRRKLSKLDAVKINRMYCPKSKGAKL